MKILKMQPAEVKKITRETVAQIVDFTIYAEAKKAEQRAAQAAAQTAYEAQCAYRARLEAFLKNLLAELEAA